MLRNASRRSIALPLLLASLLVACGREYHQEEERYFLVTANVELPYWREARAGFLHAARTMRVQADVVGPATYSPEEQLKAFQEAVAQRPAGILLSVTRPDLFRGAIDAAVAQGIPVVTMDSDAPDSRRLLFVGTDNFRAGQESGRRLAELLKGQGRVVVVTIPGQPNLDERLRGVQEVFAKQPGLRIVKTLDDRGESRIAFDEISALFMAKEKVDGIVCLEASGGSGVADALPRFDLSGKVPILAMDKDPQTLDWIERGGIAATIAQKPYTMSFYGLKMLDDLHHNVVLEFKDWRTAPSSPLPTRIDTGTAVVDKSNLAAFREALATHTQQ